MTDVAPPEPRAYALAVLDDAKRHIAPMRVVCEQLGIQDALDDWTVTPCLPETVREERSIMVAHRDVNFRIYMVIIPMAGDDYRLEVMSNTHGCEVLVIERRGDMRSLLLEGIEE